MNLRTLKKLSKRAASMLPLLGDSREQFPALAGECYHETFIGDRKHWDRSSVRHDVTAVEKWSSPRGRAVIYRTREGRTVLMEPPSHPRKGTVMVGSTTGYYEPEWSEQCAWSALVALVRTHFTDWATKGEPVPTRNLASPRDILKAAAEMIIKQEDAALGICGKTHEGVGNV